MFLERAYGPNIFSRLVQGSETRLAQIEAARQTRIGSNVEPRHSRSKEKTGTLAAATLFLVLLAACARADAQNGQIIGDTNCNGDVNSIDAALVLQRTAGLVDALLCEEAGDVNGDRLLNAVDAALILQEDAGLISRFPREKELTATNTPTRTAIRIPTRTSTNILTETPIQTPTKTPMETPTVTLIPTLTITPTETPDARLSDGELIDMTEAQASKYLWERVLPNGFVKDSEFSQDASIAATGFGLASLPVMAERYGENANWTISPAQAEERARLILDNALSYQNQQIANPEQFGKAGFLYHFLGANGHRSGESEVSTVDVALFLAGTLTAGQYFGGDIQTKANEVFNNVDWQYFFDSSNDRFYHAWKATCTSGFGVSAPDADGCLSNQQWDRPTDEIILINLLALAHDPNNQGFKRSLYAWPRVERSYGGYEVVNSYFGSLFTSIYAHAFFDFERMGFDNPTGVGSAVQPVNWFENSWNAACANRQFVIDEAVNNPGEYPAYGPNAWGLSASTRPDGSYFGDMGAKPAEVNGGNPSHEGIIPPYGAISTFPILGDRPCLGESPNENHPLDALRHYYEDYEMFSTYGPWDSFKVHYIGGGFPVISYSARYLGLDVGIEVLMIENWRSSLVNNLFMSHPQIREAVNIQFTDANLPANTK